MQPYDIFMLVVLVGAAVFGAWKGMAWQLASIGSVLLSTIVALRFASVLAPSLSAEEPWNEFLAMGILFVATSLGVWIAFRYVANLIDRVKLKEFDRQMGALFGVAKGVLYCLVLTFFAVTLSEGTRQRVLDSRSGYYAAVLVQKGTPMMPQKVRDALGKYIQKLDDGLNPNITPTFPAEEQPPILDTTPGTAVADQLLPSLPPAEYNQPGGQTIHPQPWTSMQDVQQDVQNAFRQGTQDAVNSQLDHLGNRFSETLDSTYNNFRSSAQQSTDEARSQLNERFDELGRRIYQPPMKPIQ